MSNIMGRSTFAWKYIFRIEPSPYLLPKSSQGSSLRKRNAAPKNHSDSRQNIFFVRPCHQAEPGRTSRPRPGLFFCLVARDWGGIYFVAAIHQAEPGRTSRPELSFFFCLAARGWG